jgi:DNA-binding MarR family transcriptional regulator
MNGLDLYLLGRKLTKLGMEAIPPSGFHELPPSSRAVIADVFEHPGTTISEIVERTELPQSQVSSSVLRMCEFKVFTTAIDPLDRRKTMVSPASGMEKKAQKRAGDSIQPTIKKVLRDQDSITSVIGALEMLAAELNPQEYSLNQKGEK